MHRNEIEILLEQYFDRLFPIARSLTGHGVRESIRILREIIDLEVHEVPTGTRALDWTIPKEWNVREAYIIKPDGTRMADFKENNLHLLGYSVPFKGLLSFDELASHIITRPDYPDAIPYATSYYKERWGFCISHNEFLSLPKDGMYRVTIDSTLEDGSMTYGQAILPGSTDAEILFTSYICHPSMANNELSGPLAVAFLYKHLKEIKDRKFTYRFFIGPETLGALYYLNKWGSYLTKHLEAGFVLTCCGDRHDITFKKSRCDSEVNKLVPHVLASKFGSRHSVREFFPMGSDERQYCSPGFNLPVGCVTRSLYGEYKEYHTSKDDKSVIDFSALAETVTVMADIAQALELNGKYLNLFPHGEPELGRRGLYPTLMSDLTREKKIERILFLLNYSDGSHTLLDIAEKSGQSLLLFGNEIRALMDAGLLTKERS